MFIPCTVAMLFFRAFQVALVMMFVFAGCCCKQCAVVAVVRSSSMVVLCLSGLLMSSANLGWEVRVTVTFNKPDSVVVSVPLLCLRFHDVLCGVSLNKSVLSGSPCLIPRLK